jgi:pyrroline-5-carboxylate reductase
MNIMSASICFIGAGNMALSLIKGLIASGYPKSAIIATDPSAEKRQTIAQTIGIACLADNSEAVQQADVVVLAVKPQQLNLVCQDILEAVVAKQPLIISVAAGIRSNDINHWLGGQQAIVRTMPNTPAMIQSGATGLFANPQVTEQQKTLAENIMRSVGVAVWVNSDDDLDIVTAVSGSGPAYYFLFMEAMQTAAEQMGLSAQTAQLLTVQTAFGAAKMALESADDCQTLRKKVTSPNGTTEKAIQSFEADQIESIVLKAMQAAKQRAKTLADELAQPNKQLNNSNH